jgi:hypothetical protein
MVKLLIKITFLSLTTYAGGLYGQTGDEQSKPIETPQVQDTQTDKLQDKPVENTQPVPETPPDKLQVKPVENTQQDQKKLIEETKKISREKPGNFSLGINAGYDGSLVKKLTSKDSPYWLNSLSAMLLAEFMFNDSFSLYSEMGYHHGLLTNVRIGSSMAVGGSYTEKDSLSTVEANLIARYYLPEFFSRIKFFTGLGIDVGYMSYYVEVPQVDYIVSSGVESVNVTSSAGNFHGTGIFLGASANLGVKYSIEDDLDLVFTTKFSYNFFSKLSWSNTDITSDLTHMEISFSFGPMMRF